MNLKKANFPGKIYFRHLINFYELYYERNFFQGPFETPPGTMLEISCPYGTRLEVIHRSGFYDPHAAETDAKNNPLLFSGNDVHKILKVGFKTTSSSTDEEYVTHIVQEGNHKYCGKMSLHHKVFISFFRHQFVKFRSFSCFWSFFFIVIHSVEET